MRYTNASPKRPKSNDERTEGIVQNPARERSEEQLQKRVKLSVAMVTSLLVYVVTLTLTLTTDLHA